MQQGSDHANELNSTQAWFVCLAAALFFFYEFIQMNMINPISQDLMREFSLDAERLSTFAIQYFHANMLFLIPAAFVLDRVSTKRVILVSLAICVLGNVLLSYAESFTMLASARFLTGIGGAFCFLSCIRLASRWFTPDKLAFVSGVIVAIGMTGGSVAQWPIEKLRGLYGWRDAVMLDAAFGCVILFLIAWIVKDCPSSIANQDKQEKEALSAFGYLQSVKASFGRIQNWLCGLFTCFLNVPIFLLGGLFGSFYLRLAQGYSSETASIVVMGLFLGSTIGAPLFGWISDRMHLRVAPMRAGAVLAIVSFFAMTQVGQVPSPVMFLVFLMMGIVTSAQVLSYPTVAESSPHMLTATSVSVVSFTVISSGSVFDQIFGHMVQWHHGTEAQVEDYLLSDFEFALWLIPICFVFGLMLTFLIRETHGKSYENALNVEGDEHD